MSDPGTSWHARLSRRLGAWPWARRWRAFWALLLHNIGLKLAAIIMAVALFSLVRGAEDAQRSLFVDVVALMPSARTRQVLISELPDQVKVTLRGSRSLLNAIERSDLEPLQIDLRRARRRYHYFDPTRLNLPAGVTVVQLAPSTVPLTWAARIDRRVPVQVRFLGTPGPGRSVLRPVQVRPSSLTLRGADTELKVLRSVYTAALDVRGLAVGRYQRWVAVEAAPPHCSYRRTTRQDGRTGAGGLRDTPLVRVDFEVTADVTERSFPHLMVTLVHAPARTKIRPARVSLRLRGASATLAPLRVSDIVPYVDLTGFVPSQHTMVLPVRLRGIPEGIDAVEVQPPEVFVTLPKGRRR